MAPVSVEYLDSDGYTCYKSLPGPRQSVGYYWKMHEPKNYNKLKALHEFYSIPYTSWATDEIRGYGDDPLSPPVYPPSLEAAIAKYPAQAVQVLFAKLGLRYSTFEDQAEQIEAMESGKSAEKRSSGRSLPLGAPKSKMRKQSPSSRSATESLTKSSIGTYDSIALVGYDQ